MSRLAVLFLIAACYGQPNAALEAVNVDEESANRTLHPSVQAPIKAPTKRAIEPSPRYTQGSCPASETKVQGQDYVCQYTMVFNEEFDKYSLKELTNWKAAHEFVEQPDFPFNAYVSDDTIKIEDGALVISPVLTETVNGEGFVMTGELDFGSRCTGKKGTSECTREAIGPLILPPVLTGKITTKHKFAFKYGRVEIRAKLPAGAWLIPELNLEPLESVYGDQHYASGLIRVAFAKGNGVFATRLYGGAVLHDKEPYRTFNLKEKIGIEDWNRNFHNYSVIWRPDGLELLVDGEPYGTVFPGERFYFSAKEHNVSHASAWLTGGFMAPLDQMFYVSLGLRVGGVHDFADSADNAYKPWKNRSIKGMLNFWRARDSWFPSWVNASLRVQSVKVFAL